MILPVLFKVLSHRSLIHFLLLYNKRCKSLSFVLYPYLCCVDKLSFTRIVMCSIF
uniref:Uncharacterized protein n=1 Tax=Rhizophora mucronata TaxID=61149 RepID=A0A2P2J4F2_RHIMU